MKVKHWRLSGLEWFRAWEFKVSGLGFRVSGLGVRRSGLRGLRRSG